MSHNMQYLANIAILLFDCSGNKVNMIGKKVFIWYQTPNRLSSHSVKYIQTMGASNNTNTQSASERDRETENEVDTYIFWKWHAIRGRSIYSFRWIQCNFERNIGLCNWVSPVSAVQYGWTDEIGCIFEHEKQIKPIFNGRSCFF